MVRIYNEDTIKEATEMKGIVKDFNEDIRGNANSVRLKHMAVNSINTF